MSNEILTPVGRMVQGHPMELRPVLDKNGVQKINKAGQPQVDAFVALAIRKGQETHWNQTDWGQKIYAVGQADWPRGESNSPTFAWKIKDGDSTTPNKKGKRPCDSEGFPGHWIICASSGFAPDCFAHGNYTSQVMRKETFKTGDYVRLVISAKGNGSTDSPGIYINMHGCELIQAGQAIQSSSLDAQSTFGAVAAQLPAGALVDHAQAPAAPAPAAPAPAAPAPAAPAPAAPTPPPPPAPAAPTPPAPAHDFLTVNGQQYTPEQLRGFGWTDEQIAAAR